MITNTQTADTGLRMAELLGAFAFASDLAFGLEMEDGLKACMFAVRIAEELEAPDDLRTACYYTSLLKDAGCTCWNSVMASFLQTDEIAARREALIFSDMQDRGDVFRWMRRHIGAGLGPTTRIRGMVDFLIKGETMLNDGYMAACEVSERIASRLEMPAAVQSAVLSMFERWDGKGSPNQRAGEAIPLPALIVLPCFLLAPFHRAIGREGAIQMVRHQRGKAFAPHVADAFLTLAARESFWAEIEAPGILERVLALEPDTPTAAVSPDRFDQVALAFADFIDLKSPYTSAHSRRVGAIAQRLAAAMGCNEAEGVLVKRTALMHDLGLVAVPSYYIDKPEHERSAAESEAMRLHPYHGERILARVPAMREFVAPIGAHHERFDGSGYFRGLKGRDIPLAARIVSVADRLDDLTHDRPPGTPCDLGTAIEILSRDAGTAYDPDIVRAVVGRVAATDVPRQWPASLTDREVDVLRLASKGMTRKDIGRDLTISENTVRHHLEHIYEKIGCTTRVAATLFAMEHDLLP